MSRTPYPSSLVRVLLGAGLGVGLGRGLEGVLRTKRASPRLTRVLADSDYRTCSFCAA